MAGKMLKIGFVGGGKMAQALAKGFISAGKCYLCSLFDNLNKNINFYLSRIIQGRKYDC